MYRIWIPPGIHRFFTDWGRMHVPPMSNRSYMSKQRTFLNLRGRNPIAPEPGQVTVDGYRVEALLGQGPLTAAYKAVLESHQQSVVLKVLLPHLADSEVFVQRFLQAANAARLVTHDRVLPCYDVGQSHGWVYLASELMEGGTLAELSAHGQLDRSRAIYLSWQVAMGLEAIHAAGLVHGNLRPSNVLVDHEDGVRLSDLGLPALPDTEGPVSPGTLHLPPEQILGEVDPEPSGDIYALGVILAGCLIGRTPWSGSDRQRLTTVHNEGRTVVGEVPPALLDADVSAVLIRATAKRAEERYAHVWQLREDLERLQYQFAPIHARTLDHDSGSTTAVHETASARAIRGVPHVAAPAKRRSPLWFVVGGCVLAGVVALWLLAGGDRQAGHATAPAPLPTPVPTPAVAVVPPLPKPSWADSVGTDVHGRWADLRVSTRIQRLRLIPAGNFWMGSGFDEVGRIADEDRHLVTLSRAFWLGDSEVTQGLYSAVTGTAAGYFTGDDRPVESISWVAVQQFLANLGTTIKAPVRFPSEAEWEYACRAGGERSGSLLASRAWTAESGVDGTRPVRSLLPNAWGLYDMQGNVLEWVEDTYGRYHREAITDPLSTGGVYRGVRGGAWNQDGVNARPAARGKALPITAYFYLGFRLVISDG